MGRGLACASSLSEPSLTFLPVTFSPLPVFTGEHARHGEVKRRRGGELWWGITETRESNGKGQVLFRPLSLFFLHHGPLLHLCKRRYESSREKFCFSSYAVLTTSWNSPHVSFLLGMRPESQRIISLPKYKF